MISVMLMVYDVILRWWSSGLPTHSANFENTVYQRDTAAVEPNQVMYIVITI